MYGSTVSGSPYDAYGTIFKASTNGQVVALVASNCPYPYGSLWRGTDGAFYGTTELGGTNGLGHNYGTVFRMLTSGAMTWMFPFNNTNGAYPYAGLVQGASGLLYGTTLQGGLGNSGTVFQITTNGALTPLFSFSQTNGAYPSAGLALGGDGNLYGVTQNGGVTNNGSGYGTVFKLGTNGTLIWSVPFYQTNGAAPYARLALGGDGNFYGTTLQGGVSNVGTVFRVTTNGLVTSLVSFVGTNGADPYPGLVAGADGAMYGATSDGGAGNLGTLFRLSTNGTLTTVYSFGGPDGANPYGNLMLAADGSFYGTTKNGGANNLGSLFRFQPSAATASLAPVLQSVTQTGGVLRFSWNALTGRVYQVQVSTNLARTNWNNFGSALTATNPVMTATDVIGPDARRFYRCVLLP